MLLIHKIQIIYTCSYNRKNKVFLVTYINSNLIQISLILYCILTYKNIIMILKKLLLKHIQKIFLSDLFYILLKFLHIHTKIRIKFNFLD